nr:MAG TPA: Major capsid protein [Caudoviricetes sp.]
MNSALIADPHQRKLLKKWSAILESGKKIQSESTKIALAQVLENTRNYFIRNGMLNEAADVKGNGVSQTVPVGFKTNGVLRGADSYPYTGYPNQNGYGDFYLPNVVMPMLRRVMPDLIANDLVTV